MKKLRAGYRNCCYNSVQNLRLPVSSK